MAIAVLKLTKLYNTTLQYQNRQETTESEKMILLVLLYSFLSML